MNVRLISQILNEPFLIDNERALGYSGLLLSLIKGERTDNEDWGKNRAENKPYIIGSEDLNDDVPLNMSDEEMIPANSTAVFPIRGEIMKYSEFCGPRGSLAIAQDIASADKNPNISGILLIIDSPGGQVSYTDVLADTIKNCTKPVVAFVEGMAASAAYWIASSAKKIIASSSIDKVGSIGTMMMYADLQPYYEEMGVKFHEIYATLSKDKNKDFNDVLDGKYDAYRKGTLDVINQKFHDAIRENRPGISNDVFTGKCYFAPEAITLGLIDSIGTLEDAMNELSAIQTETINLKNNTMKIKLLAKWATIASFFGFDTAKENELTEESIDKLDAELSAHQNTIATITAERDTATQELAGVKTTLEEITQNLQTANARVTELETSVAELTIAKDAAEAATQTANTALETANARIKALEAENNVLKGLPGDDTATAKSKTEAAAGASIDEDLVFCRTHTIAENVAYLNAKNRK